MNGKKCTLFHQMLSMSGEDVACLSERLTHNLVAEHGRLSRARRASPPSEASFASQLGIKPNTYSKARRRAERGLKPCWSRRSLAAIVLCGRLDDAIRRQAYVLLWRALLHGGKPIAVEDARVQEAMGHASFFADLSEESPLHEILAQPNNADGDQHRYVLAKANHVS